MATETESDIPSIEISTFELTLVGDSPLIVHAGSDKAKKEILDKQMKVAKTKDRSVRNPAGDLIDSLYWLTEKPAEPTMEAFYQALEKGAEFGFPSVAFKTAAVSAGFRTGVPGMREDMVRVGMGPRISVTGGEFREWPGTLPIWFNTAVFTHEQIINLFNLGGVACGIGEWRPERRPFRHVSCDLKKPAGHSRTWLGERGKAM